MTEEEKIEEKIVQMCEAFVVQLHEYTDSVRIFANRHSSDGSAWNFSVGAGSWFAQYGQVDDWLKTRDALRAKEVIDNAQ